MTYKNKDIAWPKIAAGLSEIAKRTPGRILAHTVSYDLTDYLRRQLSQEISNVPRLVTYTKANERQRALDIYLANLGSILLAPSLDRGIDLPDNDCDAIVVCKVPYPSLGDKQISARMHTHGGQLWYSVQTIRNLVQMTGRGMRHQNDQCDSYILDRQFVTNIWKKNRALIPKWWSDALIWDGGRLI